MVSGDIEDEFGEVVACEYAKVDIETDEVEYEVLEFGDASKEGEQEQEGVC